MTDSNTATATPLADALAAADAALEAAEAASGGHASDAAEGADDDAWYAEDKRLLDAVHAAGAAVEAARDALYGSDEPRPWVLIEEGYEYATVTARSAAAALAIARKRVERANYSDSENCDRTLYIRVQVRCDLTDEEDMATVAIEPEAPNCEEGHEHDWRSPFSVLGGVRENPGVHGHGGGVVIKEVCAHCGAYRITDTWAQRPDTGEQGLTEVTYEEADDVSLAWVARRRERA